MSTRVFNPIIKLQITNYVIESSGCSYSDKHKPILILTNNNELVLSWNRQLPYIWPVSLSGTLQCKSSRVSACVFIWRAAMTPTHRDLVTGPKFASHQTTSPECAEREWPGPLFVHVDQSARRKYCVSVRERRQVGFPCQFYISH